MKRIQSRITPEITRNFSQLSIQPVKPIHLNSLQANFSHVSILNPAILQASPSFTQVTRTVTKFSFKKGKRKTVKPALKRFLRLDWGVWIRTRTARHKKLWKKSGNQRRRLRQHVFCNSTQSWMLDKMVTAKWRKPKYYVDDPYRPFHSRETFWATKKKPIEWDY